MLWAKGNRTTFEPDKTKMMVMSGKDHPFDPDGIVMGGHDVEQVTELKITGFVFDSKLLWGSHIDAVVKKARQRIGALRNLVPYMDSGNLKAMYTTFIRSIIEYGSVLYMGAKDVHLNKLDAIQRSAQELGGFEVESLESRRKAAAISLALKLLDGKCKPGLQKFAPEFIDGHHVDHDHDTQHKLHGMQIKPVKPQTKLHPLDLFRRSFFGRLPQIWSELPQELIKQGNKKSWGRIETKCKQFFKSESSAV